MSVVRLVVFLVVLGSALLAVLMVAHLPTRPGSSSFRSPVAEVVGGVLTVVMVLGFVFLVISSHWA